VRVPARPVPGSGAQGQGSGASRWASFAAGWGPDTSLPLRLPSPAESNPPGCRPQPGAELKGTDAVLPMPSPVSATEDEVVDAADDPAGLVGFEPVFRLGGNQTPAVSTRACGLRSWSVAGTGAEASVPRATIRLSASTWTMCGWSARASASSTWA
jgi:hypothetical protein